MMNAEPAAFKDDGIGKEEQTGQFHESLSQKLSIHADCFLLQLLITLPNFPDGKF